MFFHSCISFIRGCALFSFWNSPDHGRPKTVENKGSNVRYNKINITLPDWVKVENIIPRNMIINLGCASVDNHIPRDDIFHYHPIRECNIYILAVFYHWLMNSSMWNYRTIIVVGLVTQGLGSIPWSKLEVGIRSLLRESM